jgi:hypothetical protein
MIPSQALLIVLLTLSIINVAHVDAHNEYIVEKSFYPKYSVSDLLPALKSEAFSCNATTLIDITNPPMYS